MTRYTFLFRSLGTIFNADWPEPKFLKPLGNRIVVLSICGNSCRFSELHASRENSMCILTCGIFGHHPNFPRRKPLLFLFTLLKLYIPLKKKKLDFQLILMAYIARLKKMCKKKLSKALPRISVNTLPSIRRKEQIVVFFTLVCFIRSRAA